MTDQEPGRLKILRTRSVEPNSVSFPYPPDLTPRGNFGAYLSEGLLEEIFFLARKGDVHNEHFGLLMGAYNQDINRGISWVEINQLIVSPEDIISGPSRVEVSLEQIGRMTNLLDKVASFREGIKLGWWHSHPGWGIFFSPTDKENQRPYADFSIGLVVDPIKNQWGAFKGKESQQLVSGNNLFAIPVNREIPGSQIHNYKSAVLDQL